MSPEEYHRPYVGYLDLVRGYLTSDLNSHPRECINALEKVIEHLKEMNLVDRKILLEERYGK